MTRLFSRNELIEQGYPFGKAAPGIPMGDTDIEWMRTNPDIVLYKPEKGSYTNDNEHFLAFEVPGSKSLFALWTQSSREGFGDNHLVFASSPDGVNWGEPKYIAGYMPDVTDRQASWGAPMVSSGGRIYVIYTRQLEFFDNVSMSSGAMGCIYSDDLGSTWSEPVNIPMPVSRFDNPDPRYPKNWIVWQKPIRDSKDRYITSYTLVTSKAHVKTHPMWVHADSRCCFVRFENVDDNPEPGDLVVTWLPEAGDGLEVPNKIYPEMSTAQEASIVLLPDGRLFATMRTMTGYMYYSVSDDDGGTWRKPEMLRYTDGGEGINHPLSPCPVYEMSDGRYFILHHNNDGSRLGFSQFKDSWEFNEANFFRNPTYISYGKYVKDAVQPVWFGESKVLFDTDDIAVGPKETAEVATYTSYTEYRGKNILWYPDRKYYLLGKYL